MQKAVNVKTGWLKGMYIYTIVAAGGLGLGILIAPEWIKSVFVWQINEPIIFGIIGSVYISFAILSILGLRSPIKFAPVLLLQLFYKSLWFIFVVIPLIAAGELPYNSIPLVLLFALFIIGDLFAIPFSRVFTREA